MKELLRSYVELKNRLNALEEDSSTKMTQKTIKIIHKQNQCLSY